MNETKILLWRGKKATLLSSPLLHEKKKISFGKNSFFDCSFFSIIFKCGREVLFFFSQHRFRLKKVTKNTLLRGERMVNFQNVFLYVSALAFLASSIPQLLFPEGFQNGINFSPFSFILLSIFPEEVAVANLRDKNFKLSEYEHSILLIGSPTNFFFFFPSFS